MSRFRCPGWGRSSPTSAGPGSAGRTWSCSPGSWPISPRARRGSRAEPAGRLVYIGIAGVPSPIDSRDLVLGDMTAVGILGASAGLAPAIEHYADGRVAPAGVVQVTVGLAEAAGALAGKISPGAGAKIHIDPGA